MLSSWYLAIGLFSLFVFYYAQKSIQRHLLLSHIPAVGPQNWVGSFFASIDHLFRSRQYMEAGFSKYGNRPYKIPGVGSWVVVVNGAIMEEIAHMSDEAVSVGEAIHELTRAEYTLGSNILRNPFHVPLVTRFAKEHHSVFPDINEEIVSALSDFIKLSYCDEWTGINICDVMLHVIARTANRAFAGLSLCRDEGFLQTCMKFPDEIMKVAVIMNITPPFARPLAAKLFSNIDALVDKGTSYISEVLKERRELQDRGKVPNDLLSWMLDAAPETENTIPSLARRYLVLNFAALHTSTGSLNHTLYHLAAHPEWVDVLREEVVTVTEQLGWTYEAIEKMYRIDSLIKESLRYSGIAWATMERKTMQPLTLSDGTYIPKGTLIFTTDLPHRDPSKYDDPQTFDPWRFYKMRNSDNLASSAPLTAVGPAFVTFGRGRHTCPGRFFAAMELKTIIAHILLDYDIKFLDGKRPKDSIFVYQCFPNPKARVLFRRRVCKSE
ncbi:cytochrome P450 [Fistulina hepatica ATCC 64428]|uniref:Cytochrome P450 n=1 Tax=Fistulina hepatica ATCC 64428 TaxID=1128425 RepID=A0A0D7ACS5_9AGAR|nr:cytochrome P450 [Fistulina hepatica ATCC 64428]